jgi:hypothetical protein
MNVKIGDLAASDFPGLDEAKFNEWKALKLKDVRRRWKAFYFSFPIALICLLIAKSDVLRWQRRYDIPWEYSYSILGAIGLVCYAAYRDIKTKRLQKLSKELKMPARMRAKKRGRAFTG